MQQPCKEALHLPPHEPLLPLPVQPQRTLPRILCFICKSRQEIDVDHGLLPLLQRIRRITGQLEHRDARDPIIDELKLPGLTVDAATIDTQLERRLCTDPGECPERISGAADPAERRHIRHDGMPQLPRDEVSVPVRARLRCRLRTRREDHSVRLHHRIRTLNQEITSIPLPPNLRRRRSSPIVGQRRFRRDPGRRSFPRHGRLRRRNLRIRVDTLHALHLRVIVHLYRQTVKFLPKRIHDSTRLIRIRIDIASTETRLHPDRTEPVQHCLRWQRIQRRRRKLRMKAPELPTDPIFHVEIRVVAAPVARRRQLLPQLRILLDQRHDRTGPRRLDRRHHPGRTTTDHRHHSFSFYHSSLHIEKRQGM